MTLSIYIAGAWIEQHQRARPMLARVREAGITVTHDWTQPEVDVCMCGDSRLEHPKQGDPPVTYCLACACSQFVGIGVGGSDSKLTPEQRRTWAREELRGVLDADVFWLLAANSRTSTGAWVELGAALTAQRMRKLYEGENDYPEQRHRPLIVVSGAQWNRTLFTELVDQHFDTDEAALKAVLALRGR